MSRRQQSDSPDSIGKRSGKGSGYDGAGSLRRALVGDVIAKLAPVATVGLESLCKVRFVTALQLVIYKLA